ncbi:MAG TPA: hypothetical protein DIW81_17855 [Planctomycetaceae bacterium]|nr:hypothetical protein [Rubinisphaera sp.]HCS53428.1 hypothetical protein [Planctomycetaceae bacterium]
MHPGPTLTIRNLEEIRKTRSIQKTGWTSLNPLIAITLALTLNIAGGSQGTMTLYFTATQC